MKHLVCALVVLLTACGNSQAPTTAPASGGLEAGPFKVLVYSRTAGFRHASIEAGIAAIGQLGAEGNFTVDASEDPATFSAANLAQYRVIVFLNTTLTVLDTEAQRQALVGFIANGGGWVGLHSAADTEHEWPWYLELVGAQFRSHPPQQPGRFIVEDMTHPSTAHLPNPWTLFDEFYSFNRNPRGQVRVLLSIDEGSYEPNPNTSCTPDQPNFPQGYNGRMGDHPMAWCHDRLGGRAWYTALGHEIYLYETPEFRQHVLNGILSTAKRIEASCAIDDPGPAVPADPVLVDCAESVGT